MKFTKEHEWINIEGDTATIGITEYAADALGELVYVELPEIGNDYAKGDAFAVVESSKSASDVYAPVSGQVTAVNDNLTNEPELVNNESYTDGWIAKIKLANGDSELGEAMDEAAYKEFLQDQ